MGTMVTGSGEERMTWAISSTAGRSTGACLGSGRSAPSRPLAPWTAGTGISLPSMGVPPMAMGALMPRRAMTRRALLVVFSMVWFPEQEVTERIFRAGLAAASIQAMASSWPGSPSRRTGMGCLLMWNTFLSSFSGWI